MIGLIQTFFDSLNNGNIRYCHWKSNINLREMLAGETDIDLLVDRRDTEFFMSLIAALHFKMAKPPPSEEVRSVCHYFGLDEATGSLVHLHVYYRIVTGGSLLKNYCLPLEEMLLENAHLCHGVKVPSKAAELGLYVIRKTLEHVALIEIILLHREGSLRRELDWLLYPGADKEAAALLLRWLPAIDTNIFMESLDALKNSGSLLNRYLVARRMRKCLSGFTKYGILKAFYTRQIKLLKKVYMKLFGKKALTLFTGGAKIAIVGADATGKSTVHNEISKWLSEHFMVMRVHTGRPPATFLTFVPNIVIPFLRKALPGYRTLKVKKYLQEKDTSRPSGALRLFVFAVRSLMVAYDRRSLLKKISRKAAVGAIVVCDRYPSYVAGAMDSSAMDESETPEGRFRLISRLIRLENSIYRMMPPPDIVIHLFVPVDVALKRNVLRNKKDTEDDDYVRRRHIQSAKQSYITQCAYRFDTSSTLEETILQIKMAIWKCL